MIADTHSRSPRLRRIFNTAFDDEEREGRKTGVILASDLTGANTRSNASVRKRWPEISNAGEGSSQAVVSQMNHQMKNIRPKREKVLAIGVMLRYLAFHQ